MNINQVKYFVSVFEQQSFSLAARERQVSVQAVSKSINDLEREVGQQLFERSGHGVAPTQLGRQFYQRARLALKAFAELESFAKSTPQVRPLPTLFRAALCAPYFANCEAMQRSISMFVKRNTGFDLQLSLVNPQQALSDLKSGKYDAIFTIGTLDAPDVDCVSVGSLPTGVQVLRSHPWASKQVISVAELADYPAGFSPLYDEFNDSILNLYKQRGVLGEVRRVDSLVEDDRTFMQDEQGYFFSAVFPVTAGDEGDFVLRPIDPAQAIAVPICLCSNKGSKSPNYQAIKSFMVNTVQLMQGARSV